MFRYINILNFKIPKYRSFKGKSGNFLNYNTRVRCWVIVENIDC